MQTNIYLKRSIDSNSKIMTFQKITQIYGPVCTILEYNKIIASISYAWKNAIAKKNKTTSMLPI